MIKSVSMTNFKSFRKTQSFNLPIVSGFFLVSGDNQVDKALEGNGAGKSSFWDAIAWCLYGKTARGLKASNIISWGELTAEVVVQITAGDFIYNISRTQSPNCLSVNGKTVEQKVVDDLIGINYLGFMNGVLMGQFNPFFFDLGPTDKLALFSDILNLDVWDRFAEKAKLLLADVTRNSQLCQSRLDGSIRALGLLADSEKLASERKDAWQESINQQLEQKKAVVAGLEAELKPVLITLAGLEQKATRQPQPPDLSIREEELQNARELFMDAAQKVTMLSAQINTVDSDICKIEKMLETRVCTYCGNKIKVDHLAAEAEILFTNADDLDAKMILARSDKAIYAEAIKTAEKRLCTEKLVWDKELAVYNEQVDRPLRQLRQEVSSKKNTIAVHQEYLDSVKKQTNPYIVELKALSQKVADTQAEKSTYEDEKTQYDQKISGYQYWTKAFRDIRLWIVSSCLSEFEIEVNNTLVQVGLEGWKIEFDVEKENKSGGISKGFTILVKAPFTNTAIPWESWSGGETQRLRLAGSIGLANLIRSRVRLPFNLEIWDEPTQHLSVQGIEDMLNWFSYRSQKEGKQIYLLDHHSLDKGVFDGEIHIVKDENGSSITTVLSA